MARSARVTQCIGHVTTLIDAEAAARNRSASHHRTEKLSSILLFEFWGISSNPLWKLIIDSYLGISLFHSLIIILCLLNILRFLLVIRRGFQIFLYAIYLNIVLLLGISKSFVIIQIFLIIGHYFIILLFNNLNKYFK